MYLFLGDGDLLLPEEGGIGLEENPGRLSYVLVRLGSVLPLVGSLRYTETDGWVYERRGDDLEGRIDPVRATEYEFTGLLFIREALTIFEDKGT